MHSKDTRNDNTVSVEQYIVYVVLYVASLEITLDVNSFSLLRLLPERFRVFSEN